MGNSAKNFLLSFISAQEHGDLIHMQIVEKKLFSGTKRLKLAKKEGSDEKFCNNQNYFLHFNVQSLFEKFFTARLTNRDREIFRKGK